MYNILLGDVRGSRAYMASYSFHQLMLRPEPGRHTRLDIRADIPNLIPIIYRMQSPDEKVLFHGINAHRYALF